MVSSIFQTPEWEDFKLSTGYTKSYRVNDILILQKSLPFGRSFLYSPMVSISQISKFRDQSDILEIKQIASQNKAIFYRLELDVEEEQGSQLTGSLTKKPFEFKKAFEEIQPEHTLILDLTQSETDILAQMKQKGRYNIKVAERHNVKITTSAQIGPELENFYHHYKTMATRQKISYRSKQYFDALLDLLSKRGYVKVYSATVENDGQTVPLAAAIICFYQKRATYLFGGSSNELRSFMAPYLLHWQVIRDAKESGCQEYDFFGIAPVDDPRHPWAGVTSFKRQFGGREISLLGSWDMVFRPLEYQAFQIAEKIRR